MPSGRTRTGYVYYDKERKSWTARITYRDESGKVRNIKRQVENRTEGKQLLNKLLREIEDHGEQIINGDGMTFKKLAEIYEERKLTPPVYKGEAKVSGLRSHQSMKVFLKALVEHFGAKRIKNITHSDLEKFKLERLKTTTVRGSERSITSVNRELQLMRAVLNFAKRNGWIANNPFEQGESLISQAQENRRDRVLSREEEMRLLAACNGRRAHLRSILICALDTGMRRGEILQLRWKDVNIEEGIITIRATTTKTMRPRSVPMSTRLREELKRMREKAPDDTEFLVFGIDSDVKHGFTSACEEAGIEDFHFHDCRHTATTRLAQSGLSPLEVMRITGHSQLTTLTRYFNQTNEQLKKAAAALDAFNSMGIEQHVHDLG